MYILLLLFFSCLLLSITCSSDCDILMEPISLNPFPGYITGSSQCTRIENILAGTNTLSGSVGDFLYCGVVRFKVPMACKISEKYFYFVII